MQSDPGKIGIVMPLGIQQGGAEALLTHLLKERSSRYEFVCAFLSDGPMVNEVRSLGYSTSVRNSTRVSDVPDYLKTVYWLNRWMRREKPAAVLSWMPKAHLYAGPAAALAGVRRLWYQHGVAGRGKMDRLIAGLPSDRVLCCSGFVKGIQDAVAPRLRTVVCYPGVVFPSANPIPMAEARAALHLDPSSRLVGMVARLERWKGAHILVEAAKMVSASHPGTRFFIVGGAHPRDPGYAEEVRSMVAASGLGDRFILARQRPASEVPLWQASADFLVHPVTGEEPFGMAVAESMGMGKVVVASDAGGPREIIQHGVNGLLVPRQNPAALAERIKFLLSKPETLGRLAEEAWRRGRSFSVSTFVRRVDDIVTESLTN